MIITQLQLDTENPVKLCVIYLFAIVLWIDHNIAIESQEVKYQTTIFYTLGSYLVTLGPFKMHLRH